MMIKSGRMRWVGRVAYMGILENNTKFLSNIQNGRGHIGHIGADGGY